MKRTALTALSMAAVSCAMGATYMLVEQTDGTVVKYDVDKVTQVTFEEDAQGVTVSGEIDGYTYVDLGLPSGLKWGTYNVGASKPEEYGDYFAWGETTSQPDSDTSYSLATYKWCNGDYDSMTKYCTESYYGTVDSLTTLLPEDDAATVNWGRAWRMPTRAEQDELREGCDWEWTDDYNGTGVSGQIGTSKANGNTIFLPAAGYRSNGSLNSVGRSGYYWLSSVNADSNCSAYVLNFYLYHFDWSNGYNRQDGQSVRAVSSGKESTDTNQGVTVSGEIDGYTYVDLGLPSGQKWGTYNVGASKPEEYGDYFAWGETKPQAESDSSYSWETYKFMTKGIDYWRGVNKYTVDDGEYNSVPERNPVWYNNNGKFIGDSLTTLLPEDDAATANWGSAWRMPTREEQDELINGCKWEWTDDYNGTGVSGRIGTSKANGNTIFLPAAGYRGLGSLYDVGSNGSYWSSSLSAGISSYACELYFYSLDLGWYNLSRQGGRSVRAVSGK
ncbi:MAG: hypothetical protein MJZ28_06680 [Paludibacteraceae bacterium]|nr:hypothetical protein [Paludibacteraceae bacterium]